MFFTLMLKCVSWPGFSRVYGLITRIRWPKFLVQTVIGRFLTHYLIDMRHFKGSPQDYASLSHFFIRPLNPETRPLKPNREYILSPCDGRVADIQSISGPTAIQVKGKEYQITDLVGVERDWSKGWLLCTLYLSPANYHRFHYPWSGRLLDILQLGTRLFPVNRHGVERIDGLFVRNERLVCRYEVKGEEVFATAVGATFVGSIHLRALAGKLKRLERKEVHLDVEQLDEMGHFNLGSTIVLLFPKRLAEPVIEQNETVLTGQPLFKMHAH